MDISLAICDDEDAERGYLKQLVTNWARSRDIYLKLSLYPSAEALLFANDETPIDIALLDVRMSNMDGVTLAKRLRHDDERLQIVFITGLPDYIAEGYEVSALNYLLKPVSEEKLAAVLDRAVKRLDVEETTVLLPLKDGKRRLAVASIFYVEAFSHDLLLHTTQGDFSIKMAMNELEVLLGEGFCRCHRSFLVNMRRARKITKNSVELENGAVLPLSRKLAAEVMDVFLKNH